MVNTKPEDELERLTKKLVYDMNHPPSEDYFGTFHAPLLYHKFIFLLSFFFIFFFFVIMLFQLSVHLPRTLRPLW